MIVVFVGPPGSGKGTQSAFITQGFGFVHVSTGDILRAEAASGRAVGDEVARLMAAGRLVPDELVVRVIEERLRRQDVRDGVVLDGFPRTLAQAEALDAMPAAAGRQVDLIVSLAVPIDELVRRLRIRAHEQKRSDDADEVIRVRLVEYEAKSVPMLAHYRARGTRVVAIDGVGSVEQVAKRIYPQVTAAGTPHDVQPAPNDSHSCVRAPVDQ